MFAGFLRSGEIASEPGSRGAREREILYESFISLAASERSRPVTYSCTYINVLAHVCACLPTYTGCLECRPILPARR